MSVAYASNQTNTASGNTLVITKPTSLAVGDLMVAHLVKAATGNSIDLPSGWTSVINASNSNTAMRVIRKIADSSDTSATNFTFTGSGTDSFFSGSIIRITGSSQTTPIDTSNSTTWSGTTANVDASITPTRANNLILILIGAGSGNNNSVDYTSQAIATSNPSWTEAYDVHYNSNSLASVCGSYATRPETTSTGNVSFSTGGTSMNAGIVALVAVNNTSSTTITAVSGSLILGSGTQVIKLGVKILAVAGALVLAGGSTIVKKIAAWVASSKSSTTFSNVSKSASPTWTNQTKSSSSWDNKNKSS